MPRTAAGLPQPITTAWGWPWHHTGIKGPRWGPQCWTLPAGSHLRGASPHHESSNCGFSKRADEPHLSGAGDPGVLEGPGILPIASLGFGKLQLEFRRDNGESASATDCWLCDLGQVVLPLWACFFICKTDDNGSLPHSGAVRACVRVCM